jgi:ABC-type polysaccharide/polyol phosphate export permease
MWQGDYGFVLRNLILKDFRIRYRNMSLGMLWSLLNPLVMMSVLTFVFVKVFHSSMPHFPVFVLCGLVPFNFFSIAWVGSTTSLADNAGLIKYVQIPRAIVPISAVLAACPHLVIQLALVLGIAAASGIPANVNWIWLPVVFGLELVFLFGLGLLSSAINVYVRDTRYVVESANTVLFYLVPIFYSFAIIPQAYREVYQYNPIAALILAVREIVLEGHPPSELLLLKMFAVSMISAVVGWAAFRMLEKRVYDHL